MKSIILTVRVTSAFTLVSLPATVRAQQVGQPAADTSIDKSAPTFTSISDGQPADPGQFVLAGLTSVTSGDWEFQSTLQYTPKGEFWSNALFSVSFPTINAGENIADAETSATFSWQQRWFGSSTSRTTFSTTFAVQVPVDEPNTDVDFIASAGVTQIIGKGIGYLNGFVETQSGPNPAPTEWGLIAGYKLPVSSKVAIIGDVVYSTGDNLQLETSLLINATDKMTIGPGAFISTTLDDGSSDVFVGAGLVMAYSF